MVLTRGSLGIGPCCNSLLRLPSRTISHRSSTSSLVRSSDIRSRPLCTHSSFLRTTPVSVRSAVRNSAPRNSFGQPLASSIRQNTTVAPSAAPSSDSSRDSPSPVTRSEAPSSARGHDASLSAKESNARSGIGNHLPGPSTDDSPSSEATKTDSALQPVLTRLPKDPDGSVLPNKVAALLKNPATQSGQSRWQIVDAGRALECRFKFSNFRRAKTFTTKLLNDCLSSNHHPVLTIASQVVTVRWGTHRDQVTGRRGIGPLDVQMARQSERQHRTLAANSSAVKHDMQKW